MLHFKLLGMAALIGGGYLLCKLSKAEEGECKLKDLGGKIKKSFKEGYQSVTPKTTKQ